VRILSRYAESLFWLARYLERSASLARVIEMQSSFGAQDEETGWAWLLTLHADHDRFKQRYDFSTGNVVAFYVLDAENPGSIRSSLHWARENARALRPYIPLEMWVQLNAFHAATQELTARDIEPAQLPRTCSAVRAGCLAQFGTADGTLFRDEGHVFFKLGQLIERADQTSRLLDVKFAQASSGGVARPLSDEFMFATTILRTASAYQAFRRLEPGNPEPGRVARFLILNPSHPRSIGFCVREIERGLQDLRSGFRLPKASAALEACDILSDGLQTAAADRRLETRLHEFNDWVQRSLNSLSSKIDEAFFRTSKPMPPAADTSPSQAGGAAAGGQGQTQS
jgi:uncharacterized alpha-E superfamily protein